MDPRDPSPPSSIHAAPAKKAWTPPEIRDQSIKSLTEAGKSNAPSESSPLSGPS